MPGSNTIFAAVAACLAGVDPADRAAVSRFYRRLNRDYPAPARALIADFLIGLSGPPSARVLDRLNRAVAPVDPWTPAAQGTPALHPARMDAPPSRASRALPAST